MDRYHQFSDFAVKKHFYVVDGKNVFFFFFFFKTSQREVTATVTIRKAKHWCFFTVRSIAGLSRLKQQPKFLINFSLIIVY